MDTIQSNTPAEIAAAQQEDMPSFETFQRVWRIAKAAAKDKSGKVYQAIQNIGAAVKSFDAYVDTEVEAMPLTEPDWIIPKLLARQNLLVIGGEPKAACKSWLMLNLACDLAEGRPIWGVADYRGRPYFKPSRPMRVAYFSLEDTIADLKMRRETMKIGGRATTGNLILIPKNPRLRFDAKGCLEMIHERLREYAPIDLMIFDPLRNLHAMDENSSSTVTLIKQATDILGREFNCSTIVVHHEGKPHADDSPEHRTTPYALRGSTALYGTADSILNVVPVRSRGLQSDGHQVAMYFSLKRAGHVSPVQFNVDTSKGTVHFEGFKTGRGRDKDVK